jgi:hypothetical protein
VFEQNKILEIFLSFRLGGFTDVGFSPVGQVRLPRARSVLMCCRTLTFGEHAFETMLIGKISCEMKALDLFAVKIICVLQSITPLSCAILNSVMNSVSEQIGHLSSV